MNCLFRPNRWHQLGLTLTILCALLSAGCISIPVRPTGDTDQETIRILDWVDQELEPYLVEQLVQNPRFQGQAVSLVGMDGAEIRPDMDDLTRTIRSRLHNTLLQTPGVKLVAPPSTPAWQYNQSMSPLSCEIRPAPDYHIGIEIIPSSMGNYRLQVRALDLSDNSWVGGIGRSWEGTLTHSQQLALSQRRADEFLRGTRILPFTSTETDLLAAYLARNLGCLLRRRGETNQAIYLQQPQKDDNPTLYELLPLVGNYLTRLIQVRITPDPDSATLVLHGRTSKVHGGLHQVWIMLKPRNGHELPGIDTDAYAQLNGVDDPSQPGLVEHSRPSTTEPVLSPIRVLTPPDPHLCATRAPWVRGVHLLNSGKSISNEGCFALELEVHRDTRIFLLNHRVDGRLVRILPSAPGPFADPDRRFSQGEILRLPTHGPTGSRSFGWESTGGYETFYALAIADPTAADRVSGHLERLAEGYQTGTNTVELEGWLKGLDQLLARLGSRADWQAVRIMHAP